MRSTSRIGCSMDYVVIRRPNVRSSWYVSSAKARGMLGLPAPALGLRHGRRGRAPAPAEPRAAGSVTLNAGRIPMAVQTRRSRGQGAGSDAERLDAYLAARRRGIDWLLGLLNADGRLGDPEEGYKYYRALWTFARHGRGRGGPRRCGWIRAQPLAGRPAAAARRSTARSASWIDGWGYRDSALIIGAQMLHQYDLGIGLLPALLADLDPISGSVANDHLDDGSLSDDGDIPYTCGVGFAALACGDIASARRIAGFLRRIYDAQTELPESFYCFWSRSRQAPIWRDDPDFQLRMVVDNDGRPVAALDDRRHLGRLPVPPLPRRSATRVPRPRPPIPGLLDGRDGRPVQVPGGLQVVAGARSLLYQVTGERAVPRLDAAARRLVRRDARSRTGYWHPLVEHTQADVIEVTLEFVMHLDTLIGALSSRPSTRR